MWDPILEKPQIDETHRFVSKPWGFEYLVYQNKDVGLWYLHIADGQRTSLHCHPNKKTGLVILSGCPAVQFLNDIRVLKPRDKLILRAGLFHSTSAPAKCGPVTLLEIETPPDKGDLVRFEDNYGRAGLPYEQPDTKQPENLLWLSQLDTLYPLPNTPLNLKVMSFTSNSDLVRLNDNDLVMVLNGGLVAEEDQLILSPADAVTGQTLQRLSARFRVKDLAVLVIA